MNQKDNTMPIFVVQKHASSTLHYDFRLEIDNVLKSWVVPKGPTLDPLLKRLAIPTDDHNLEFSNFEGVISGGQYGAGKVIIWDQGEFENQTYDREKLVPIDTAYTRGKITISLKGKKLNGKFTLLKTKKSANWLLLKHDDDFAKKNSDIIKEMPASVYSNKCIEDIL